MDNIEIDPVLEVQYLKSMYRHYRNLYRQIFLLCCSSEKEYVKKKRDDYKAELEKCIGKRCENV